MAESLQPKKKGPPKRKRARPDYSTWIGIAVALTGILGGLILENGHLQDVTQVTAALIVFGGTLGAVLFTTPLANAIRGFRALKSLFFEPAESGAAVIEDLIQFAIEARKNGIVSLEAEALEIPDPFFNKALNLAVDGTELQELRKIVEIDIAVAEQAAEGDAKVWESAGGYSPTVGIIGAVMGLIQVMKHLEDLKAVGHGIAGAFVATLYGVAAANLFFLPAAAKLRTRARKAILVQEMILEGVSAIAVGLNPALIRLKLESYIEPSGKVRTAKSPNATKRVKPAEMKSVSASG